ncbi:unnamed protein product [Prunus brigantina]
MDSIVAANGLSFQVEFSGHSGHLRLEPLSTEKSSNPINSLHDFILDQFMRLSCQISNGSLAYFRPPIPTTSVDFLRRTELFSSLIVSTISL